MGSPIGSHRGVPERSLIILEKPFLILDKRLKFLVKPMHGTPCMYSSRTFPGFVSGLVLDLFPDFSGLFFTIKKSIFYEKMGRKSGNLE